jgi:hypothetical protein
MIIGSAQKFHTWSCGELIDQGIPFVPSLLGWKFRDSSSGTVRKTLEEEAAKIVPEDVCTKQIHCGCWDTYVASL